MARFCSNCGKEIGDAQFCVNCGTKVSNTTVPTATTSGGGALSPDTGMDFLKTMIISVVCTILLLFKWITLEIPFVDDLSVNCFNFLFKMFAVAEDVDGLGFVVFISFVIFVLACVVAVYTIRTIKAALEKSDYAPTYCGIACKVSFALSVIMIAIMIIFKAFLESEVGMLGALVGELFNLTAAPYILLVFSIIGIWVSKTIDEKMMSNA